MMMNTLVMKFGGASVATPEHFSRIADIVLKRMQEFRRIAIVVSAMGNTTDQLIALAKQVNPDPPRREYDMLVSVGERISISLLAMALAAKNHQAISFTGSQSGIITCGRHTDARIVEVRPHRILPVLDSGTIVIVAGFQGVSRKGEITTLGRGGSDTSAVALGAAIGASKVEFFKDVPGVCLEDPKSHPATPLLKQLSYEEAMKIVIKGAKVLHPRSIQLACKNSIPLHVRSFYDFDIRTNDGTIIGSMECPRCSQPVYEDEF
jgi:aspartate kinase